MRAVASTLIFVAACGSFGESASEPQTVPGPVDASAADAEAPRADGPDAASAIVDAASDAPGAAGCRPVFSDGFDGPTPSLEWEVGTETAGTHLTPDSTKSQAGGQSLNVLLDASAGSRVSFLKKAIVGSCPVTIDAWYQPDRVPAVDENVVYLALALEDSTLSLRYAAKTHELVVTGGTVAQRISLPNLTPGTWSHLVMTYDANLQKATVTVGTNAPRVASGVKGLPMAVRLGAVLASPGASFSSWYDSFSVR